MREPPDPERIPKILEALGAYWKRHPELRLGQIVSNMTEKTPRYTTAREDLGGDIFYVHDEALLEALKAQP